MTLDEELTQVKKVLLRMIQRVSQNFRAILENNCFVVAGKEIPHPLD
ncbi:hypothetical protein BH23VER1_BH23VER1_04560 [soil metagenome]